MSTVFLIIAVMVSGAAVLSLELLGTRVIGPFAGVSLYLWSALIGVTLAALSLGYALGGRWADRGPTPARFSALFAAAGVWVLAVPWLRAPVLAAVEPLGLRAAVLAAAVVLFLPPLLLLGMVSPYAIRLKATRLEEVGRTAGNLYALSTLASVAAALGTGFFLIPNLGVTRLLLAIGLLLVGTGAAGWIADRRPRGAVPALLLPLLLTGAAGLAPGPRAAPERGLLAVEHSAYAEIRVIERDGRRSMLIDGAPHTIVFPDDWSSAYPYVHVLEIGKRLRPQPGRLLLVGLGGGSVAKSYARDGWRVDAVEIDPAVTRLARSHFGLRPDEAAVHHRDGRRFLAEAAPGSYDLIILDAYGSSAIPFHLVTAEAFALVRSRLAPGGLLAVNIEAVGWDDVLVRAVGATVARSFPEVRILPIAEPPDRLGNLILLAAEAPLTLARELPPPQDRQGELYDLVHAWDNRFAPDAAGPVLTDDRNPVDLWSDRINLVARKQLHRYYGEVGIDR